MIQNGIINHFDLFITVLYQQFHVSVLLLYILLGKNINSYARHSSLHILSVMHTTDNIIHFATTITFFLIPSFNIPVFDSLKSIFIFYNFIFFCHRILRSNHAIIAFVGISASTMSNQSSMNLADSPII